MVADGLGLVNRVMPASGSTDTESFTGKESSSPISDSMMTALGRRAAEDLHQYPEKRSSGDADPEALLAD